MWLCTALIDFSVAPATRHQVEVDGHEVLGDDVQAGGRQQVVDVGDAAGERILDRDHRDVGLALLDRGEAILERRARQRLGVGIDLAAGQVRVRPRLALERHQFRLGCHRLPSENRGDVAQCRRPGVTLADGRPRPPAERLPAGPRRCPPQGQGRGGAVRRWRAAAGGRGQRAAEADGGGKRAARQRGPARRGLPRAGGDRRRLGVGPARNRRIRRLRAERGAGADRRAPDPSGEGAPRLPLSRAPT